MHHRHLCAHAQADALTGRRGFRLPGDRPQWGRPRPFALTDLTLSISLDFDTSSIDADADLTLSRIDPDARWAELDAIAFDIREVVRLDGAGGRAAFEYDGEILRLDLSDVATGESARVRVHYRATPRRGLYFKAPDASRPDRPRQIWTQCQDQDGRHWFPCQDHPGQRMTTRIGVVVPAGWFALGNGVLEERTEVEGGTRFVWYQAQPHPAYLVTLAAGVLDEAHDDVAGLPVDYYVPKGHGGAIARSLGRTPEMIKLFAEKLATPYPWAKYAQIVVADFTFGGMENTSATTLFERALLDERAALDVDMEALVAHELAHQWFGDLVTCRDWSHAWLNEGFATYMEHVWKEHVAGRDAYLYNLEEDLALYLAEHGGRYGRPVVEKVFATPIDVFDRHLYQKGGLFLHALRSHLGDASFFRALAFYLARHRGGSVETRDLLRALEDATGRSLEELFHQWIERAGHPALEVSTEHVEGLLKVTVTQTQARENEFETHFHLRLPVSVISEDGRADHFLDITRKTETFAIESASSPTMVLVDPELTAPGTIELKLSVALLIAQLERAPTARPRWCAARALASRNEPRAVTALAKALASDPFFGVRLEAAKALGEHRTEAAEEALFGAESDADPHVRRAVAEALGETRTQRAADRLVAWFDRGDPSYLVEGAIRRGLGGTKDPRTFDRLAGSLKNDRGSWGEVVSSGAADGLARLRDPRSLRVMLEVLAEITTPATLARAVIVALGSAPETVNDAPLLREIRDAMTPHLDSPDPNVRIAVARLMARLGDAGGYAVLARLEGRDLDGRVRRAARESRQDLGRVLRERPEVTELKDQVELLRKEVAELRAKVGGMSPEPTAREATEGSRNA